MRWDLSTLWTLIPSDHWWLPIAVVLVLIWCAAIVLTLLGVLIYEVLQLLWWLGVLSYGLGCWSLTRYRQKVKL